MPYPEYGSVWGEVRILAMKVPAMLQALDMHRLRGTPKGICTDRNIGTWKGRGMELTAAMK